MESFDPQDVLGLHASAMYNDDGVLIFLGPSGTGKSTMCELLKPTMEMLANDTLYLVPQPGQRWYGVFGEGRVHGKNGLISAAEAATAPSAPLRAVFRLYQTVMPRLEPLDRLWCCRYLTDAFFEIAWQRDEPLPFKQRAFANLSAIARSTPGYAFHFGLSAQTLDALNLEMKLW